MAMLEGAVGRCGGTCMREVRNQQNCIWLVEGAMAKLEGGAFECGNACMTELRNQQMLHLAALKKCNECMQGFKHLWLHAKLEVAKARHRRKKESANTCGCMQSRKSLRPGTDAKRNQQGLYNSCAAWDLY
eukprot:1143817-Pelagomonas_calceolata.AAC.2